MNCSCRLIFPIEGGETKHAELVLPDFQYEYIEDTPARLFHQVNYGTGIFSASASAIPRLTFAAMMRFST